MLKYSKIVAIALLATFTVWFIGIWWLEAMGGGSEYLVLYFFRINFWHREEIGRLTLNVIVILTFIGFISVPLLIKNSIKLFSFQLFIGCLILLLLVPSAFAIKLDHDRAMISIGKDGDFIFLKLIVNAITFILSAIVIFLGKLQFKVASKDLVKY